MEQLKGIYRGRVTRVSGNKLCANIPSLHGTKGETTLATPIRQKLYAINPEPDEPDLEVVQVTPSVGSLVWIGFENGDISSPVWLGI